MKKNSLPKIGIRPVIDGRRMGVRESLEEQTMNMAKATAALIAEKLRHACGAQIECVIADTCIAGMAESAACEEKFSSLNVGVTITVTPCWCYGSETIDMDPMRPKAIWGFNGTERPGAVYLAAALAAHNQKGLPAFSIYGHDVQDAGDTTIPADVEEKLLRFARAGLAVAGMKGKTYLSVGGVSMGIAGSIVDHNFFESWLGMKVQPVDMTELRRRIDQKIYDEAELEMALAWADKNFRYGEDQNAQQYKRNAEQSRAVLKESLLMAMCIRDMMQGNSKLAEKGLVCADSFVPVRQWQNREKVKKATARQRVNARVMAMSAGRWDVVRPVKQWSEEAWLEAFFTENGLLCRETFRKSLAEVNGSPYLAGGAERGESGERQEKGERPAQDRKSVV